MDFNGTWTMDYSEITNLKSKVVIGLDAILHIICSQVLSGHHKLDALGAIENIKSWLSMPWTKVPSNNMETIKNVMVCFFPQGMFAFDSLLDNMAIYREECRIAYKIMKHCNREKELEEKIKGDLS